MPKNDAPARFHPLGFVWIAGLFAVWPALGAAEGFYFRDHTLVFFRLLHEVVASWAAGELPLWDPHAGGGEPLAANPAALAYSPMLFVFALTDHAEAYDLFVILHLFVAMGGGYFLGRSAGCSPRASATVAAAVSLSGLFTSMNSLLSLFASLAFAPWALGFAIRTVRSPRTTTTVLLAFATALHAMSADPSVLVADLCVFFVLCAHPLVALDATARLQTVGHLIGAAVSALALSACVVLPALALLADAPRGEGFAYEQLSMFSLHPARVFELLVPGIGGPPMAGFLATEANGRLYLPSIYAGASLAPLVLIAWSRPGGRRLAGAAALFVIVSVGPLTPLPQPPRAPQARRSASPDAGLSQAERCRSIPVADRRVGTS